MKNIINKPLLITLVIFLTLVFLGMFAGGIVVRDRLDHIVYGNKFLQIDEVYESEIKSQQDNLSTITIHMKNPALENIGNISFQIVEGDKLIREVDITGNNVGDPGDVKLKFDPIPNSAGKTYTGKIIVNQNDPKLSVFVDDNSALGGWFYYRNQVGISGVFKLIFSFVQKLSSDVVFLLLWGTSVLMVSIMYYRKI